MHGRKMTPDLMTEQEHRRAEGCRASAHDSAGGLPRGPHRRPPRGAGSDRETNPAIGRSVRLPIRLRHGAPLRGASRIVSAKTMDHLLAF
jgi:hypothetical protein